MLVHLPGDQRREPARRSDHTVKTLPPHLLQSLTWDQGSEMAAHHALSIATDIPIHFRKPGSPWQPGSNKNTNGLLRQYFSKGTNLARTPTKTSTQWPPNSTAAHANARLGNPSRAPL